MEKITGNDTCNELFRLSTLATFPGKELSLIRLAQTGFYYEGKRDEIMCFSCGLRVRGLQCNPFEEHKLQSKQCEHLSRKLEYENGGQQNTYLYPKERIHVDCMSHSSTQRPNHAVNCPSDIDGTKWPNHAVNCPADIDGTKYTNASIYIQQYSSENSNIYDTNVNSDCASRGSVFTNTTTSSGNHYGTNETDRSPDKSPFDASYSNAAPNNSYQTRNNKPETFRSVSIDGDPNILHQYVHSPASPFIQNHAMETSNDSGKPIAVSELCTSHPHNSHSAQSSSKNEIGESQTSCSEYESLPRRKASFRYWPANKTFINTSDLAECGFFFTNKEDHVKCFSCGIVLKDWTPEDNEWVEHVRFSPTCQYVYNLKGQDFIHNVLTDYCSVEEEDRETTTSSTPNESTAQASTSHLLEHNAVRRVIQQNIFQDKDLVLRCMSSLIEREEINSITPELLVESILDRTQEEQTINGGENQHVLPSVHTDRNCQTHREFQICESQKNQGMNEQKSPSLKIEKTDENPEKLEKENEELRDLYTCKICLDEQVGVTFVPCGHLVTCKKCSPKIRKCPLCRTFIRGTIKTSI